MSQCADVTRKPDVGGKDHDVLVMGSRKSRDVAALQFLCPGRKCEILAGISHPPGIIAPLPVLTGLHGGHMAIIN